MLCSRCGAISTILLEDADGYVEPLCEACYYNVKFEGDDSGCEEHQINEKNDD